MRTAKRLDVGWLGALGGLAWCGLAAGAVNFDFEDQTATATSFAPGVPRPGALTSLTMTKEAITATITRVGNKRFDIMDATAAGLPYGGGRGDNALDSFYDGSVGAFIINFSVPLTAVSMDLGDYQPSDPDLLVLNAFSGLDGTGSLLGAASDSLPDFSGSGWLFRTLSLTGLSGAQSIVVNGGVDSYPNSVFYDNLVVEPVPEPTAIAALVLSLPWLAARRCASRC